MTVEWNRKDVISYLFALGRDLYFTNIYLLTSPKSSLHSKNDVKIMTICLVKRVETSSYIVETGSIKSIIIKMQKRNAHCFIIGSVNRWYKITTLCVLDT